MSKTEVPEENIHNTNIYFLVFASSCEQQLKTV